MAAENNVTEQINRALEERLEEFKSGDYRLIPGARNELNSILTSLLAGHAIDVNVVIVELMPDFDREPTDLPNSGNRDVLKEYVERTSGKHGLSGIVDLQIVDHPSFLANKHDVSNGYKGLVFAYNQSEHLAPFSLVMDLGRGFFHKSHVVYFLPQEIKSIRVAHVADSEYSPRIEKDGGGMELHDSHTAEEHYLLFRGFGTLYHHVNDRIPKTPAKGDIGKILHQLLLPGYQEKLLTVDLNEPKLSGFAAHKTDDGFTLYEFGGVELPSAFWRSHDFEFAAISAAYVIAQYINHPQSNITTYQGADLIARLHQAKQTIEPKPL